MGFAATFLAHNSPGFFEPEAAVRVNDLCVLRTGVRSGAFRRSSGVNGKPLPSGCLFNHVCHCRLEKIEAGKERFGKNEPLEKEQR